MAGDCGSGIVKGDKQLLQTGVVKISPVKESSDLVRTSSFDYSHLIELVDGTIYGASLGASMSATYPETKDLFSPSTDGKNIYYRPPK